jgi:flagellum-specific peptidoglycan hydrolase FlgJ
MNVCVVGAGSKWRNQMKKTTITFLFMIAWSAIFSQTYFIKYQTIADSFETVYRIPSAVILAVAYHESGGGKSNLATKSNNHFGIRGKKSYRKFESDVASYEAFCRLVTRKTFYSRLIECQDPKKWIAALSNANYAGGSATWPKHVIEIIDQYDLD